MSLSPRLPGVGVAFVFLACAWSCSSTKFSGNDDAGTDAAASDAAPTGDASTGGDDGGIVGSDAAISSSGCSDGTRETFDDVTTFPGLAGCSGGWSVAGFGADAGCNRAAGSDSIGVGCRAEDLCAEGWHVCTDFAEVATRGGDPCPVFAEDAGVFFATAQRSTGGAICVDPAPPNGADDIFGCGTLGQSTGACSSLKRFLSTDDPKPDGQWSLGSVGNDEWDHVRKGRDSGGVLCCK